MDVGWCTSPRYGMFMYDEYGSSGRNPFYTLGIM